MQQWLPCLASIIQYSLQVQEVENEGKAGDHVGKLPESLHYYY
jgi:hypothetical protein